MPTEQYDCRAGAHAWAVLEVQGVRRDIRVAEELMWRKAPGLPHGLDQIRKYARHVRVDAVLWVNLLFYLPSQQAFPAYTCTDGQESPGVLRSQTGLKLASNSVATASIRRSRRSLLTLVFDTSGQRSKGCLVASKGDAAAM